MSITMRSLLCVGLLLGSVGHASAQAGALTAPSATPPPAAPAADPVPSAPGTFQVRVVGDPEGLVLHHASGGICRPNCELALAPGLHQFALSLRDGDAVSARPVMIDRPGLLRAEYQRHSGTRATGWAVFGVGASLAILGAIGGTAGILSSNLGGIILGLSSYIVGGVNLVLALALGLPLAMVGDSTSITFE